ncbi:hypothetical protein Taro_046739 [Colocasia esculenta]|uniref:Uncharacterized protein n=1 Tax=Colocasia esculenta TaxID=4460 RepID=A0A843WT90_COLES|nr:hypothetical protein [Colocasia esculenta]
MIVIATLGPTAEIMALMAVTCGSVILGHCPIRLLTVWAVMGHMRGPSSRSTRPELLMTRGARGFARLPGPSCRQACLGRAVDAQDAQTRAIADVLGEAVDKMSANGLTEVGRSEV